MTRVQIIVHSTEGDIEVEQDQDDWSGETPNTRVQRIDQLLSEATAKVVRAYSIPTGGAR